MTPSGATWLAASKIGMFPLGTELVCQRAHRLVQPRPQEKTKEAELSGLTDGVAANTCFLSLSTLHRNTRQRYVAGHGARWGQCTAVCCAISNDDDDDVIIDRDGDE